MTDLLRLQSFPEESNYPLSTTIYRILWSKMSGRLKKGPKEADGWWVIQLFSSLLPLIWVYSEIVICRWWCVCLPVLQQPGTKQAQTDGLKIKSTRDGTGQNRGQHPMFDVFPVGHISSVTSCMVLTDGTSRHHPTGDADTEAWNRRRHECETWITYEWELMYDTVQGNSISPFQPFIVHNTCLKFHIPYCINQ